VSVKRRESLSRKVRLNCCADFFGRISLGKIRGMGSLVTSLFSASGPPFFGLLFDYTESYYLSFNIFIGMLFTSAVLSLCLRPPTK
jgi:hypothetical protein